jgi:hypothetical protein
VPTEDVARAIQRAGYTPHPAWLDFHERYAGFEEPLGRERAICGIVHTDSYWLKPGEASADRDDDGHDSVVCAEVHPSFAYRLRDDCVFTSSGGGGPCETYDAKTEQSAIFHETKIDGRRWVYDFEFTRIPAGGLDALREAVDAELISEASDRFGAVFRARARDVIWLEGRGERRTLNLWTIEDAQARVKAVLRGISAS